MIAKAFSKDYDAEVLTAVVVVVSKMTWKVPDYTSAFYQTLKRKSYQHLQTTEVDLTAPMAGSRRKV